MAAVTEQKYRIYEFGRFRLDATDRLLTHDGIAVPLAPKVFDTLVVLVEQAGHLVTKDDLMSTLWPDSFVEEGTLTRNISDLRKILEETGGGERYIETVPRHGYRFNSKVTIVPGEATSLIIEKNTRSRVVTVLDDQESSPSAKETEKARRLSLRWVIVGIALVATLVGALLVYRNRGTGGETRPVHSIAVLPLENLSGDPAQEFFADGMTESLISNLAQIRALKVISRTSVMRYKGVHKALPEIARELNVDAVLEGTVQRSGGRVQVTAQLIHAASDTHLWARNYERDLTDVLKLQSEVARAVADEIRVQVRAEERARFESARSVDPKAHEAYELGRYYLNKSNDHDWKLAIDSFERAIQLSPDYAAAYAGLSSAWLWGGIFETNKFSEVESPARAAALKAIALDDQLAEAHIALGDIHYTFDWNWEGGEREMRRALDLDPGGPEGHISYGHLLMALGRHEEAIHEGEIAEQLDPVSSKTQSALGRFLYRARKYPEALAHLERAVQLEPRSLQAYARLAHVYALMGRYDEAIAAFIKTKKQNDGKADAGVASVYALMGKRREALRMIKGTQVQAIIVAPVYAVLGDKDEAFSILEKAVEERSSFLVYLKEEPTFDNLRSDPRWSALLRRMNFPPESN